jgi:hypothetical protein
MDERSDRASQEAMGRSDRPWMLLWIPLLLLSLSGKAQATICVEVPALSVKEVRGTVIATERSFGSPAKPGAGDVPIPEAHVHLLKETAAGTSTIAEATTDAEGRFHIPWIGPGLYTLEWDTVGFTSGRGRIRVRRFVLRPRAPLILYVDTDFFGCGGNLDLRKSGDGSR